MTDQLSDDQISAYYEAFILFDLDGDGVITVTELGDLMRNLGQVPTDDDLQEMVNEVDRDGNGMIDFPKFITLLMREMCDTATDVVEAFRRLDKDGNGYIGVVELRFALKNLRQPVADIEADEMISEADIHGNGQIKYREFAKLMHKLSRARQLQMLSTSTDPPYPTTTGEDESNNIPEARVEDTLLVTRFAAQQPSMQPSTSYMGARTIVDPPAALQDQPHARYNPINQVPRTEPPAIISSVPPPASAYDARLLQDHLDIVRRLAEQNVAGPVLVSVINSISSVSAGEAGPQLDIVRRLAEQNVTGPVLVAVIESISRGVASGAGQGSPGQASGPTMPPPTGSEDLPPHYDSVPS